ncbi:BTAD domain-containing putative transcriptional regulator [Nonomuraea sp. MG754425]|uniref:AfsR/SARP family transcriptional regulator n=1 Tax=Nonomuraea sp. MG754425 TaxID=2570319 RepID=UPI001F45E6EC|nr:BTAD domain-containing putative transcriptional regulator [Nonomuraea sp. MG754425]
MVMLLAAVLIVRRRARPGIGVAGSSAGLPAGRCGGRGDGDMVASPFTKTPEIDTAAAGLVAGSRTKKAEEHAQEKAEVDEPRLGGKTAVATGETGIAGPGHAAVASSAMLMASGFVEVRGKAKAEVLGVPRLSYGGTELSFGRAEASDLFALLSTSPEGLSTQNILDTLWPDDDARGRRLLESAVRQLNQVMRQASGLAVEVKFVLKTRQRRHLAAAHFDVDYWRFEKAFIGAGSAAEESARLAALQEMLALYQGPLLAGRDALWVLPLRQAAQRQAVDAAERLAELVRVGDPDRALDVLRLAVERIDPYSEMLWCQLMTVQGELGRQLAVRRSFGLLQERLAEIDAVPSRQARQIFERFVR